MFNSNCNKCGIQDTPGLTTAPYPASFYDVGDNSWNKYAVFLRNGAPAAGSYDYEHEPSHIFR